MTDEQIIKAYERCFTLGFDKSTCYECPFYTATAKCTEDLRDSVLALINRQKEDIERLEKENAKQKAILEAVDNEMMPLPFETDFDKAIKTAKSEAIKEFVDMKDKYYVANLITGEQFTFCRRCNYVHPNENDYIFSEIHAEKNIHLILSIIPRKRISSIFLAYEN